MKSKLLLIVTIVTLFFFPKINFGQVVSLGSDAAKFVLFTSAGAVGDNVSAHSHITGDVGTNTAGSITGFGNVNGVMHDGSDAATTACGIALAATIAQINSAPATIFPPSGSLGSGVIFTPGVYSIPGSATLTLDLILDAQNISGAQFIIKIGGTFSTNTLSSVKLINGALACNVYWQVTGFVSMASLSTMRGNIISGDAITMGSGDSLEGRAFSTPAGAINIDGITAFTPIGCNSPVLTGPHIPDLASAACYTIFSSNGALNGNLSSTSKGDVGSNSVASVTGWNAGNVTGILHLIPDPSTIQCAIDVSNLYDTLNAMVPDIELLYPSQFGNNLVLTPHVYLMNSGGAFGPAAFTDSIYLDAQGDPNGVFVIKIIGGALTTSTYSNVKLINGAQSKNVFWMVDGAVSINNYSTFRGTIVVSAGALNLVNTGVVLDGRALTMTGAITTAGLAAATPPGSGATITTQPTNQIACTGSSVNFSVVATGNGLTYQWRKGTVNLINGVKISGANSDTLKINPVNISDTASNYNVVINGACSSTDTSINVSLKVDSAFIITKQPVNQIACAGSSVNFSIMATGTGLTYQWRKGNVNLINGIKISGVNSDTLKIDPVSISDTSSFYNVIISGACTANDTSKNVSLTVNASTIITTAPVSQTICAGDSVSFFVVASGSNLTYQWRKGNVNLINGVNISGATSDTLTINPATISDIASDYNVVITGGCPSINTLDTNLNSAGRFGILAGTAITSTGASVIKNVDVGLSPGVHSSITGFPPAIVVNGAVYASDDIAPPGIAARLIQAKQDLTNAYLFAEGATAPAPATVAGDQGGKTLAPGIYKSTSTLLIQSGDLTLDAQGNANAVWIFQIASDFTTIGGAGGNVILTGGAQAKNITWQVGSSATIGNGTSFKGNILALTSITMNTGSTIDGRLLARNGAVVLSGTNIINGPLDTIANDTSITSINVSLAVNTAPAITNQPANQKVCAGSSVSFSVTATGSGLTYQWRKGNVNLSSGGNMSGTTTAMFTINPVNTSDSSLNYNVIISGTCLPKDTSINVSLKVYPVYSINNPQSICNGGSYIFNGHIYSIAGNYNDTLATIHGCDSIIVTQLTVNSIPVAIATSNSPVCVNSPINLIAQTVSGATYLWAGPSSFSSSDQDPVFSALSAYAGIYSLTVTSNGCPSQPAMVTVIVNDCEPIDFNIPEGFSPNGDGINDLFVIRGIERYPANTFTIYNRWGDEVFEASPYQNTWDGKATMGLRVGGNELPVGTYFYILNLGDGSSIYKGTIYLNR